MHSVVGRVTVWLHGVIRHHDAIKALDLLQVLRASCRTSVINRPAVQFWHFAPDSQAVAKNDDLAAKCVPNGRLDALGYVHRDRARACDHYAVIGLNLAERAQLHHDYRVWR
jgi:hypothetical protein